MKQTANLGIFFMLIVALLQSIMSAQVKLISPHITTAVQVLTYYLVPLVFLTPILIKNQLSLKTEYILLHLLRGMFAAGSVFCFFYASQAVPLGVANLLFNCSPIFIPLLSVLFLSEKTSKIVLLGIAISVVGVITVIHPKFDKILTFGNYIGLASGILMAFAQIMLRRLVQVKEPTDRIVFYLYSSAATFSILFILVEQIWGGHQLIKIQTNQHAMYVYSLLLILGITSLIAQRILTMAFQYMPAAKLAPFLYVSIPISGFLGWFCWGQGLSAWFYAGGVLILLGMLIIVVDQMKEARCDTLLVRSLKTGEIR